jgi:hypothetical protein
VEGWLKMPCGEFSVLFANLPDENTGHSASGTNHYVQRREMLPHATVS